MTDAVEIAAKQINALLTSFPPDGTPEYGAALARAVLTAVLDAVTLEWRENDQGFAWADTVFFRYTIDARHVLPEHREAFLVAEKSDRQADYRARLARALVMEEG